jgi:hypothetical protein
MGMSRLCAFGFWVKSLAGVFVEIFGLLDDVARIHPEGNYDIAC